LWPCSSLDSLVASFEWKEENEEDGVIAPSQSAESQLPKVKREQHQENCISRRLTKTMDTPQPQPAPAGRNTWAFQTNLPNLLEKGDFYDCTLRVVQWEPAGGVKVCFIKNQLNF